MRTRDGVTLRSDVYRPNGEGPFPVLLRRTPYGNQRNDLAESFNEAHYFASHGYLVVVQDTRGRFSSEGEFYPFIYEGSDGYDSVEWAAALAGSTGEVGTFGQSYGCIVQYQTAVLRPPHLRACVPLSGPALSFRNNASWYTRGQFELSWTLNYFVNMAEEGLAAQGRVDEAAELTKLKADPSVRFSPLRDEELRRLPVSTWGDRLGEYVPFLRDVLYHDSDGPYWWYHDLTQQVHNVDVPMLHMGSWYDFAAADTLRLYRGVKDHGLSEHAREHQALFMGPWGHLLPYNQPTSGGTGDIDFGPQASVFLLDTVREWFDHFLKGPGEGLPGPEVRIFVMGDNAWRDEHEWPLTRAIDTRYYLHSAGAANGRDGDGILTTEQPGEEPVDSYRYDPAVPVPTLGGHFVGGGVRDQSPNQGRPDVLVYTSALLTQRQEITGPVSATLFVSTSAVDTDFVVVLSDVHPDGFAQNLLEGSVRGRYLESMVHPTTLQPGRIYEIGLDLWALSHVLHPGHQLRLHVTSSDFPRWDRNLNTGAGSEGTEIVVAEQTVVHDAEHASYVVLPLVPA